MEQVSSELKTVKEQIEACPDIEFENTNLADLDRCFHHTGWQAVEKAPETCDLKVDQSRQRDGKEEIPATASSVEPKPTTVPTRTSSVRQPIKVRFADDDSNSWVSDDDDDGNQGALISTSYHVDRMASDGRNVMYTSYFADESDLIAYCLFQRSKR